MRLLFAPLLLFLAACGRGDAEKGVAVPGREGVFKTAAIERSERRLYDGAPPVIPHQDMGMGCVNCHNDEGIHVPDLGFAPAMPHGRTRGLSAIANCRQCHVFRKSEESFRKNEFVGLRQDLRKGKQLHFLAPLVIPHRVFMRENCRACHDGPAVREEIRCTHPERPRCTQCHVEQQTLEVFAR
ncbi:MAG: hypothetical protein ACYTGV_09975 [Planctomycetota bacterium]|jgi:cytochrome c-type protein NapB